MTNQLIQEKSPYLLQHADNPVNWYPWCEEAFQKAKDEHKPVFVSIGYATCHWCHVMAAESFSDEQVADVLNEKFISIKVDREERPDIDAIYIKVCQAMTGQAGWPLNVFLTPEQKPFYVGTYFPRYPQYQMPGFMDVLTQLSDQYHNNAEKITNISQQVTEAIQFSQTEQTPIDESIIKECFDQLYQSFDEQNGGFGQAPKFPAPHQLMFLLQYSQWQQDDDARHMACKTLKKMAAGGLYDHIGFGFSRYAVDQQWQTPHFEKMLYDQAMLAMAYIEGFQVTADPDYKRVATEILDYVRRVMTDADGGFYSAEDADSEGVEGRFYTWDYDEVIQLLGEDIGRAFCHIYHVTPGGHFNGRNVLYVDTNPYDDDLLTPEQLAAAKQTLFAEREKRVHPDKDDKILTAWNGLMVAAFAKAARVFQEESYQQIAREAIAFIEKNMWSNQRLMSRYKDGDVRYKGYLDDYAYMLWAYIEMYETDFAVEDLEQAHLLARDMKKLFWDDTQGGFYFTGYDQDVLIARSKEWTDGALPSGNSVAAQQLLRLAGLSGFTAYEEQAEATIMAVSKPLSSYPHGFCHMMSAFLLLNRPRKDIVIMTPWEKNHEAMERFLTKLQKAYIPHMTYLAHYRGSSLQSVAPFAAEYQSGTDGLIYVCENHVCQLPTDDTNAILAQLGIT